MRFASPSSKSAVVGPLCDCLADVDSGTTIIDFQFGIAFRASVEIIRTGRMPCCSEPDRGWTLASQISPLFILGIVEHRFNSCCFELFIQVDVRSSISYGEGAYFIEYPSFFSSFQPFGDSFSPEFGGCSSFFFCGMLQFPIGFFVEWNVEVFCGHRCHV